MSVYADHAFQLLLNAISANDARAVEALLGQYGSPSCMDPLWLAAEHGHIDCLNALINTVVAHDTENQALKRAAARGHSDCIAVLLPFSCSEDTRTALIKAVENSSYGMRPLCEQRSQEYRRCITMLLEGCDGPQVLSDFQMEYPGDTQKWGVLEECLQIVQRDKILNSVDRIGRSVSRKM